MLRPFVLALTTLLPMFAGAAEVPPPTNAAAWVKQYAVPF